LTGKGLSCVVLDEVHRVARFAFNRACGYSRVAEKLAEAFGFDVKPHPPFLKPGNAGAAKGPTFRCAFEDGEAKLLGALSACRSANSAKLR
jgi:hypothetical protein